MSELKKRELQADLLRTQMSKMSMHERTTHEAKMLALWVRRLDKEIKILKTLSTVSC